jgi:hypothetical protein
MRNPFAGAEIAFEQRSFHSALAAHSRLGREHGWAFYYRPRRRGAIHPGSNSLAGVLQYPEFPPGFGMVCERRKS